MAIRTDGPAPYAPAHAVLTVIRHVRERGIPRSPLTSDILMRMGLSESLAVRALQSLKTLELVGEDGTASQQLEDLRQAKEPDFQQALETYVRITYAVVFEFVEPADVSYEEVREQFRNNTPHSQMDRMAKLFMGLCEAAGIVEEAPIRRRASTASEPNRARTPRRTRRRQPAQNGETTNPPNPPPPAHEELSSSLPKSLAHLVNDLPKYAGGWTKPKRDQFLNAFTAFLDLWIDILPDDDPQPGQQGELGL